MLPQAAAAWPSPHSLDAGCAGFYAGARHGVAQGGTCAGSGSGGSAVAALARRGQRQLLAGARHGVARGGTCAASGGGGLAVAALARRGLRLLLRWRASRCGARRHVCCLRLRRLGRRRARSARALQASTLARVTVWREAARVPPQVAAAWLSLRSLGVGSAGFYAGARHGVARGCTCAASEGGVALAALARREQRRLLGWRASRCGAGRHMCRLRRQQLGRCCARTARAAPASTLARVTVWRGAAHVPPQAAAAWPLLRSLGAGCPGSWVGARHGVARGGTCAASGGGGLAVAVLAQRVLPRFLGWRASRCGEGRHLCRLKRRRLGRRCARSERAAPASALARVTVWREAARVPPQAVTAMPLLRSLDAGCAGFYAGARHGVARGGTCAT